ncbi:hypothetical protein, partial [Chitinophaga sp.]|uniref:hypothetical protein n=1 Tax=Chitinophaga sp. TaxID=1869181 RepID=UPI002F91D6E6
NSHQHEGTGNYHWHPVPCIKFHLDLKTSQNLFSKNLHLNHDLISNPIQFSLIRTSGDKAVGYGFGPYLMGQESDQLDYIKFHFTNFRSFSGKASVDGNSKNYGNSLKLRYEDYIIEIQYKAVHESITLLKDEGGFLITTVGTIRKKNGTFSFEQCSQTLEAFTAFISFFNGLKVKPVFIHGFKEEKIIFRKYSIETDIHKYRGTESWMPRRIDEEMLNVAWQRFAELWKQEDERHILDLSIHWYLEALITPQIESAIILAQTSLESIASLYLKGSPSNQFNRNTSAEGKLNSIFGRNQINKKIPANLTDLVAFATTHTKNNGAAVLTTIRNTVAHSDPHNISLFKQLTYETNSQALSLALYYFDVLLLKWLGYKGTIHSRVADRKNNILEEESLA